MLNLGRKKQIALSCLLLSSLALAENPTSASSPPSSPVDTRSIAEAWGDNASIADCYSNTKSVGINDGGQRRSDISNLVRTDKMTFLFKVKSVRVCTLPNQTSRSLIQAIQFTLGTDNNAEDKYELDVIGFEYGNCETVSIRGTILDLTMLVLQNQGIQRLTITDTEGSYTFGPAISRDVASQLKQEVIRFGDQTQRPIGLFGSWKFQGLRSLGAIVFDTECIPKNGVYKEPKAVVPNVRIVEVIKEVPVQVEVEKEKTDPIPIIILAVLFFVTVALIIFFCLYCMRRQKRRIQTLEEEKAKTAANWAKAGKKQRLVAVGDGVPDYAVFSEASSNSININIHEESSRVPLNQETQACAVVEESGSVTLRSLSIKSRKRNSNDLDHLSGEYTEEMIAGRESIMSNPKIIPICSFVDYEDNLIQESVDSEDPETIFGEESKRSPRGSQCSHCDSQRSQKYVALKPGARRRSLSYEYLKNQESKCKAVACKRCARKGIMHPGSASKEVNQMLKTSGSSFMGIGDVIHEEAELKKRKFKRRRRFSISVDRLRTQGSGATEPYMNEDPVNIEIAEAMLKPITERKQMNKTYSQAMASPAKRSPKRTSPPPKQRSPAKDVVQPILETHSNVRARRNLSPRQGASFEPAPQFDVNMEIFASSSPPPEEAKQKYITPRRLSKNHVTLNQTSSRFEDVDLDALEKELDYASDINNNLKRSSIHQEDQTTNRNGSSTIEANTMATTQTVIYVNGNKADRDMQIKDKARYNQQRRGQSLLNNNSSVIIKDQNSNSSGKHVDATNMMAHHQAQSKRDLRNSSIPLRISSNQVSLVEGIDGIVRTHASGDLSGSPVSFQHNLTNYFLGGMHSDKNHLHTLSRTIAQSKTARKALANPLGPTASSIGNAMKVFENQQRILQSNAKLLQQEQEQQSMMNRSKGFNSSTRNLGELSQRNMTKIYTVRKPRDTRNNEQMNRTMPNWHFSSKSPPSRATLKTIQHNGKEGRGQQSNRAPSMRMSSVGQSLIFSNHNRDNINQRLENESESHGGIETATVDLADLENQAEVKLSDDEDFVKIKQ